MEDRYLVTWDGPDDPLNPKNWPFRKRWAITAIASSFTFVATISTSMTAPALDSIASDLKMHNDYERFLSFSIFVLAYAFGPFVAGPASEMYGRRYVLQLMNLGFLAFNTGCGFAQTATQLIVCRFFAGFGGCAGTVIGAGILGDIWRKEERGKSVALYTMVTLLSPTLGPVLGGFITQYSSWRWSFWAVSITGTIFQVVASFFFRESFPPIILGRKATELRHSTGNEAFHTKWERPDRTMLRVTAAAFIRPFKMLVTQPIVIVLALYISYAFGLIYLVLSTFAGLWTVKYHQNISIGGLHYLALAIGYVIGTQSCTRLIDIVYHRLTSSHGAGVGRPEYRLPILLPGTLVLGTGMLLYGWSAENHLFWIIPDIGMVLVGIGSKYVLQCTQLYALDVYPTYAASASAASMFLRSLCGFAFPLFAPYMYNSLGYGWGNTVLAFIAIFIGLPVTILLWIYGPNLRKRSTYASG
ncbi:MFS multidrug transporter [Myriangium duriaei CBS 260.36]|uniref:Cercosporin MFS transporter CTB4 n=1 Tax=Myriangium duriaei CBS 260.36 TaxID=1168546 RepID=A0A9P4MLZ5_9PEZI|nr:MFS multidrug transporter [Myriangium duriaei CBS 260.36]